MRMALLDWTCTLTCIAALAGAIAACGSREPPAPTPGGFDADLAFLRQHTPIVVLSDTSGARVAVAPAYQGRVMTSTVGGSTSPSFGWIGRAAIGSGQRQPHMNVFGGEDRFWLGPEGGQFSLYFKAGDPFDLAHWQVPEAIDWGAWDIVHQSATEVRFRKRMHLTSYSGTTFDLDVERTVRMLSPAEAATHLGEPPGSLRIVGFESANVVTNAGTSAWRPESGLVSVWILGMFSPSDQTTVAVPYEAGPEAALGPVVNDTYFGKVPSDRLAVKESVVLFKGDGRYRSKIGLSPERAIGVAGSYDAGAHVLTLVQYTRAAGATRYVNSMWEVQREPYKGDAINSYNDGPPAPDKPPLGPFYELETSSPALTLEPAERYTHVHRTFHLVGGETDLDRISRRTLRVGVGDIATGLGGAQ